uniref:Uncharacterized protein n=1 Tax=Parascaris univalens TaxID=6257 RepID=A0A915CA91_PARUN
MLQAPLRPPQAESSLHGANVAHAPQLHLPSAIPMHFPKFC